MTAHEYRPTLADCLAAISGAVEYWDAQGVSVVVAVAHEVSTLEAAPEMALAA